MRTLLILGATGSIGTTALNAVRQKKLDVRITGLVAHSSSDRLRALAEEFSCPFALNTDSSSLRSFIRANKADIALNAIAGAAGLEASLFCLQEGMDLALANKESVVMGGQVLFNEAKKNNARIIPVDSEHSAIYHLLKGRPDAESLVITASGGPFLGRRDLENVSPEEAANHPTWKMGRKISIDSSTLANKGLEVIEAGFLFNMPADRIEVTIHRQSVVHSMVRMKDGSVYAQLSPPDMTLPIVSAVNDDRQVLHDVVRPLSFSGLTLTFQDWDRTEFPLLALAYKALERKKSYPVAFNAADEVAVAAFCDRKIRYTDIARIVSAIMEEDWSAEITSYEDIIVQDRLARLKAGQLCSCHI